MHIFYQNSNVTNATAKFLWERVERVLDYLDEMFTFHPSPTEINKGRLTLSSRRLCRHHRHLLCRRLRLPLCLARLALVEGGHRQLPTDQKGLSRGILDVFCPRPMVRLVAFGNLATMGGALRDSKMLCRFRKLACSISISYSERASCLEPFAHCGLPRDSGHEWPRRHETFCWRTRSRRRRTTEMKRAVTLVVL